MKTFQIPGHKFIWFRHKPTPFVKIWLAAETMVDFYIFDTMNFHRFENKIPCHAIVRGRKSLIENQTFQVGVPYWWYTVIGNHQPYVVTLTYDVTRLERPAGEVVQPAQGQPLDIADHYAGQSAADLE